MAKSIFYNIYGEKCKRKYEEEKVEYIFGWENGTHNLLGQNTRQIYVEAENNAWSRSENGMPIIYHHYHVKTSGVKTHRLKN